MWAHTRWIAAWGWLAGLMVLAAPLPARAAGRVELDLAAESGLSITAQQEWSRLLSELNVAAVRIARGGLDRDLSIERRGSDQQPLVRVRGRLTARGEMLVPGQRFNLGQRAAIRAWLDGLIADPRGAAAVPRGPYGLTSAQTDELAALLAERVDFKTAGMGRGAVLARLRDGLGLPLEIPADLAGRIRPDDRVEDELSPLARGTALALLLSPLGLAFQPRAAGGGVELVVLPLESALAPWPAGRRADDIRLVLPKYFESLDAQLDGVPLTRAVEAIAQKLAVPVVFDRAALARHKIALAASEVSVPERSWVYLLLIREIMRQSRLRCEVYVDDAQRPFLWIIPASVLPPER